jgi:hypothetical protein
VSIRRASETHDGIGVSDHIKRLLFGNLVHLANVLSGFLRGSPGGTLPARVAFSFDIGAGFAESFFAAIERIEGPIAMV